MKARLMENRDNDTSDALLEKLDKLNPPQRFEFINRKLAELDEVLSVEARAGFTMKRILETLLSYDDRVTIADKFRSYIKTPTDLNLVATTLHPTQQDGFKHHQREYWKGASSHFVKNENEGPAPKSIVAQKKRELAKHGIFIEAPAPTKKEKPVKVVVVSHYNLRPRRK